MSAITLCLVLVGGGRPAAAHERVTVGEYELTVGWVVEPAVVGVLNGLDLGIHHVPDDRWVGGMENNLTALLSYGSYSVTKQLGPQEGRTGWYTFGVIPTRNGTYAVHLTGSLNGTSVDVRVNLDDVSPRSNVEFPVPDPTTPDLKAENAALRSQVGTATLLAAVGVLAGLVGLGTAVVAVRRSRPRQ